MSLPRSLRDFCAIRREKNLFFLGMLGSYKFGVGPLSWVRIVCRLRRKPETRFSCFFWPDLVEISARFCRCSRCRTGFLPGTCQGYFFELNSFLASKTFKNNVFMLISNIWGLLTTTFTYLIEQQTFTVVVWKRIGTPFNSDFVGDSGFPKIV